MKNIHKIRERSLQQILMDEDLITRDQLVSALDEKEATGDLLIQIVLRNDYVQEMNLAKVLVKKYQLPFLHPQDYSINKDVKEMLAAPFLHKNMLYPLDLFGQVLVLVSSGNLDTKIISQVEELTKKEVAFFIAPHQAVQKILNEEFPLDEITNELNNRMDELFGMS
ncbi:MAG: hypothetical protein KJ645_13855 [Planctomycetes bacterium]|nr:hypothetical protein [Planctomycetota bacterium]